MLAKDLEKTIAESVLYKLQCFWLRLKGCQPYLSGYSVKHIFKLGDRVDEGGKIEAIIFCGRWNYDKVKYPNQPSVLHHQLWVKRHFWG